jgi:hypothetical protein
VTDIARRWYSFHFKVILPTPLMKSVSSSPTLSELQ